MTILTATLLLWLGIVLLVLAPLPWLSARAILNNTTARSSSSRAEGRKFRTSRSRSLGRDFPM